MSDMKKYLFAVAAVMMALTAGAQVKPGIEVLREGGFAQLKGKRVGLLTNPTGVDNNLKSTVDILHEAEGVDRVHCTVRSMACEAMFMPATRWTTPSTPPPA